MIRYTGAPESLTSDRGPQSIAAFFNELCHLIGVNQNLSTAGHPQTNGNTEIVNRYIKLQLRPFVNYYQDDWSDRIPAMDFVQAVVLHKSISLLPRTRIQPRMSYDWFEGSKDFTDMSVQERLNREEARTFATRTMEAVHSAVIYLKGMALFRACMAQTP